MSEFTIDILLPTYNGAKYLQELLASLKNQTWTNWRLLTRDDGSNDRTPDLIVNFQRKINNPKKIIIFKDSKGNLGPVQNYAFLMQRSTSKYVMFSDQDDVWKTDKIKHSIKKIKKIEKSFAAKNAIPVVIHSDLTVVNHEMNVIATSFWTMQKLNPNIALNLKKLLFHNVITGCTMILNRAAVETTQFIPKSALMHDYWIALIIAKFGQIDFIPEQTLFYRQHTQNEIGAKYLGISYFLGKITSFFKTFQKYLIMFQDLPYNPPILKGFICKIFISIKRLILPERFFTFSKL